MNTGHLMDLSCIIDRQVHEVLCSHHRSRRRHKKVLIAQPCARKKTGEEKKGVRPSVRPFGISRGEVLLRLRFQLISRPPALILSFSACVRVSVSEWKDERSTFLSLFRLYLFLIARSSSSLFPPSHPPACRPRSFPFLAPYVIIGSLGPAAEAEAEDAPAGGGAGPSRSSGIIK